MLFDNFLLAREGTFREEALRHLLTDHPYPARNPDQNIADLKAQIAANERGTAELRRMVAEFGLPTVQAYMGHVQDNAAEEVARLLGRLEDCSYEYPTDTGQVIRVRITVDRAARQATVDFHRHQPRDRQQLQRARAGDAGRRALLFPRHGRSPDPDERRLPAADPHHHSRGLDAEAGLSARRRRGQRGNQPACDERDLRRARRHRQQPGDDEQPDLRERHSPVLRDDLFRQPRGRDEFRTRVRRHLGRACPHDQLAPDRPRGAGDAVPR